jgi:hypothetical protein
VGRDGEEGQLGHLDVPNEGIEEPPMIFEQHGVGGFCFMARHSPGLWTASVYSNSMACRELEERDTISCMGFKEVWMKESPWFIGRRDSCL